MKTQPIPSTSVSESPRCLFRTQNGQCRMLAVDFSATLCVYHARQAMPEVPDTVDLLHSLTQTPAQFHNVQAITNALGSLFSLVAQGRISPRRATALAYIANLLLHNLPATANATHTNVTLSEAERTGESLDSSSKSKSSGHPPALPAATNRDSVAPSPIPASPRANLPAFKAAHSSAPTPKSQPLPETVEGFLAAVRTQLDTTRNQRDTS